MVTLTPNTQAQPATTTEPPLDPHQQLLAIQAADSATVATIPDGAWLPQVSSKQTGPVALRLIHAHCLRRKLATGTGTALLTAREPSGFA